MTTTELTTVPSAREARVNVTYAGANGELPDPVPFDATDSDVRQWVAEALRSGGVPGVPRSERADLGDFVVERFAATPEVPVNRIMLRPKTGYGV